MLALIDFNFSSIRHSETHARKSRDPSNSSFKPDAMLLRVSYRIPLATSDTRHWGLLQKDIDFRSWSNRNLCYILIFEKSLYVGRGRRGEVDKEGDDAADARWGISNQRRPAVWSISSYFHLDQLLIYQRNTFTRFHARFFNHILFSWFDFSFIPWYYH